MVGHQDALVGGNGFEEGADVGLCCANLIGNLTAALGVLLTVVSGQFVADDLRGHGHAVHVEPEVRVLVAVFLVALFVISVFTCVLTEGDGVNHVGDLDHLRTIGCCVVEGVVESGLEPESVGDDDVGLDDLGDLGGGGGEVVRIRTDRHEGGHGCLGVCARDDALGYVAKDCCGGDDVHRGGAVVCGFLT